MIIFGSHSVAISKVKLHVFHEFEMKDLGLLRYRSTIISLTRECRQFEFSLVIVFIFCICVCLLFMCVDRVKEILTKT